MPKGKWTFVLVTLEGPWAKSIYTIERLRSQRAFDDIDNGPDIIGSLSLFLSSSWSRRYAKIMCIESLC